MEPYRELVNTGLGSMGWECLNCGALVIDKDRHNGFHDGLAAAVAKELHLSERSRR